MFRLLRSSRPSFKDRRRWDMSRALLEFSKGEPFTVAHSFEGIALLGGPGSGKTTTSGYQFAMAMLKAGYGALVLTAKVDEIDRWIKMCRESGRSSDLIVFDDHSGHRFNFLNYLATRKSVDTGLSSVIVYMLEELAEIIERSSGLARSRGDEQFWNASRRRLAQNAIDLLLLTQGHVSIPEMADVIRDAPRSMEELNSTEWRERSLVYTLLTGEGKMMSSLAENDLLEVGRYFTREFVTLSEKTRSIIEASLSGVLHLFLRGQLRNLFGGTSTVSPDDIIHSGKIVVVNLPIKSYFGVGAIAQSIWKMAFQQRAEQRAQGEDRPCMLFIDEAQALLSSRDANFAATARSSRVCNLWITQNISNLYMVTGGDETGRAAADSLLALASTKIFHANSCPLTGQWAADLIGKRRTRMRSSSVSHPKPNYKVFFQDQPQVSSSSSESFEYAIPPHFFSMLRKAGAAHKRAEAIVVQAGRQFKATGESYCRVYFEQGY